MTILESISLLLAFCTVSPNECLVVENEDTKKAYIAICTDDIQANRVLNVGIIDLDNPDERVSIIIDTECTDV